METDNFKGNEILPIQSNFLFRLLMLFNECEFHATDQSLAQHPRHVWLVCSCTMPVFFVNGLTFPMKTTLLLYSRIIWTNFIEFCSNFHQRHNEPESYYNCATPQIFVNEASNCISLTFSDSSNLDLGFLLVSKTNHWLVGWLVGLFGWLFGWLAGWFVGLSVGWLFGWLVVWWVGWLIGWLVGWLVCWLVGWLVGWFVGWSIREATDALRWRFR